MKHITKHLLALTLMLALIAGIKLTDNTVTAQAAAVKQPSKVKISRSKDSKKITVRITKPKGVTGVQVAYKTKSARKYTTKKTKNAKYVIKTKAGKDYQVKVRAYKKSGSKTKYSKWSKVTTKSHKHNYSVKISSKTTKTELLVGYTESKRETHVLIKEVKINDEIKNVEFEVQIEGTPGEIRIQGKDNIYTDYNLTKYFGLKPGLYENNYTPQMPTDEQLRQWEKETGMEIVSIEKATLDVYPDGTLMKYIDYYTSKGGRMQYWKPIYYVYHKIITYKCKHCDKTHKITK